MADEQAAETEFPLQFREQLEDRGLDQHVEGTRGFVGEQAGS
jgi:hypothetical protein